MACQLPLHRLRGVRHSVWAAVLLARGVNGVQEMKTVDANKQRYVLRVFQPTCKYGYSTDSKNGVPQLYGPSPKGLCA